jgi:hypothetical protein
MLIALDQFLFVILTLGWAYPDETFSAACWRWYMYGKWYGKPLVKIIDFFFLPIEKDHCKLSHLAEINNKHLPRGY